MKKKVIRINEGQLRKYHTTNKTINKEKMVKKQTIKLNENQLHKIIKESVKMVIKESQPGSISHGTMRTEDLIPTFMSHLFKEDPKKARMIWKQYPNLLQALCDKQAGIQSEWWDSDEAIEILNNDLFDIMQNYAPEDHYFGSHPGDASDYGYWKNEM